jgi:RNA polymerase sigma factor (sigma-70 family)
VEGERVEMAELGAGRSHAVVPGLPYSFTAEFEHLYECAYRAAYRILGNQLEAEHVAQEACSQAGVRWNRLTRRHAPEPWLVRVAAELAIEQYQHRQRAQRRTAAVPGLFETVDRRRVAMHRALNQLPQPLHDVVMLRYVVGLDDADTAAALGRTTRAVKRHSARGLSAFRALLGEERAR